MNFFSITFFPIKDNHQSASLKTPLNLAIQGGNAFRRKLREADWTDGNGSIKIYFGEGLLNFAKIQ